MGTRLPIVVPDGCILVQVRGVKYGDIWIPDYGTTPNGDHILYWQSEGVWVTTGGSPGPTVEMMNVVTGWKHNVYSSNNFLCFYGYQTLEEPTIVTSSFHPTASFIGGMVTIWSNDERFAPINIDQYYDLLGVGMPGTKDFLEPSDQPDSNTLRFARLADGTRVYVRR